MSGMTTKRPHELDVTEAAEVLTNDGLSYFDKRMKKRLKKLEDEDATFSDEEEPTGVREVPAVLPAARPHT
jgi:hypothetical protein